MPQLNALSLGAVILAAGSSSRMGRPKMLLPWRNNSVIGHLISQWTELGAGQVAVVCATEDAPLEAELERLCFSAADRIINPCPDRGMFSSIQCAAAWGGWSAGLSHFVIVLGDQPHLRLETLGRLLAFAGKHPEVPCQPSYLERPRHPVLLPRRIFLELADSRAAHLKEFLGEHHSMRCEIADPALDLDIDRPEDYERARDLFGS